ncbi:ATP--guanido phosphotransferase [Candidatus Sumerlaeota bacterium]|nr:ATP--guanido phosphotransferase [Candidatus Sumerlaeota bacterium]
MAPFDLKTIDRWMEQSGPQQHVVISSRIRYARNLAGICFPPHASNSELKQTCEMVDAVMNGKGELSGFQRLLLTELTPLQRNFLRESRFITNELESGGEWQRVYLRLSDNTVVLLNEEDHLRMFCIQPGFQLFPILSQINPLDDAFAERLPFAWDAQLGYLTSCPSNTGTGIRASVMLHLPALNITDSLKPMLSQISQRGMAVRGCYGENTEHFGDIYQISNERTLGQQEDEIIQALISLAETIVRKEDQARGQLFDKHSSSSLDMIGRAYGILRHTHEISSREAMKYLSRLRLGIDRGLLPGLTHEQLSNLMVQVQPAHTSLNAPAAIEPKERDILRAAYLREVFKKIAPLN